jgi:hypothetical protein
MTVRPVPTQTLPGVRPVIDVRAATKIYGAGGTEVRALNGVDLLVERGDYLAIMGASGSGKSTLMTTGSPGANGPGGGGGAGAGAGGGGGFGGGAFQSAEAQAALKACGITLPPGRAARPPRDHERNSRFLRA